MKKSIFAQLCMSLLFLLLVPVVSQSQELTEAQKKERCQNNYNRLAELKTNLKVIEADLLKMWEDKQVEDARKKMVIVRNAKNAWKNEQGINETEIRSIASRFNYKFDECIGGLKTTYMLFCLDNLEELIGKAIDDAVALKSKKPGLILNKKNIEKQIQEHRTSIIAYGCEQNPIDCTIPKISGKYISDGDPTGFVVFTQSGNSSHVDGKYGQDINSLKNELHGDFVCSKLTGTFINTSYKDKIVTGTFTYVFSADGSSYTGTWKNDSDGRTGPAGGHRELPPLKD